MKKKWVIDMFYGGLADGSKRGIPGSFRSGIGLDYRTDPDILTANKKLTKNSGSIVTDMPKWMVTEGTNLWVFGDTGKLYKRTSAGVWSLERTVSNSHGNGLAVFDNYLYYGLDEGFGRYGPLDGTPAYDDTFLESVADEFDQGVTHTNANIYTPPVAIDESATHRQTFTAGTDNITGVSLIIVVKGTGDWTITVHDSSNNLVAAKTITNANLVNSSRIRFLFTGDHDLISGNAYHIHITSGVADGTVRTDVANDLEGLTFTTLQYYNPEDWDQSKTTQSAKTNVAQNSENYATLTAISEASVDRLEFVPEKTTQVAVSIPFLNSASAGDEDITLTIHDDRDTVVATKTESVLEATANKSFVKFVFATSWTAVVGATYHMHITSAASVNILTSTDSDFSDADYITHYQILETDTDYHPMVYFPASQSLAIGNGNFLSSYDGITYRSSGEAEGNEKLMFSKETKVRSLALVGDYLAIGTWKGDSIDDHGESIIYFWDGSSPSYNAFKRITGETNAMVTGADGLLYVWHGGFGHLSVYDGSLTLVKTIPSIGENKNIEIFPGAVTSWNGIPRFGISDGDSTTAKRGVYSFGKINKNFPISLNLDAPISTGTTGINAQVSALLGIGPDKFFVGWKDDTSYGVDLINTSSDQASVEFETLIFDAEMLYYEKKASSVKLTFKALGTGDTITVKYKLDNADSWTTLGTANYTDDGAIIVKSFAFDKRFRELELQIILATTGSDAPELTSITTFFTIIEDEQE